MDLLSVIRRWSKRDQLPIRDISRRTGLSRNTIRKYLREDTVEPVFKTPVRPGKLDAYADRLTAWLQARLKQPRKQRCTLKQMHADLVKLGYEGSYGRVAAFARVWREDRHQQEQTTGRGTFVPLVFQPGEAFQFDWSEDWAIVGGELVFHVFGAIAHFEARLISERTKDGLATARKHGRKPGRLPLEEGTVSAPQDLVKAGNSVSQAAKHLGIGRSTAYKIISENN